MKLTGMLMVSLSGANHGFWCQVGCLGRNYNILAVKVYFRATYR